MLCFLLEAIHFTVTMEIYQNQKVGVSEVKWIAVSNRLDILNYSVAPQSFIYGARSHCESDSNTAHLNYHFLWGLNLFFMKPCLAVWLLLCFVYFDYPCHGFFWANVPRETGISIWKQPPDEIMKNEKKQKRRRGEGRNRRWKDIAEEWLSPSSCQLGFTLSDWLVSAWLVH